MDAIVLFVIITALVFDLTNGFHGTANALATSISTGALSQGLRSLSRLCSNLRLMRWRGAGRVSAVSLRLDGEDEFGEGCWEPVARVDVAEFVVATAEILHECVSDADHSC